MRSLILPWAGLARWARLTSLFGAALIASCSSNDGITFVGAPTIIKVTGRIDISAEVATDAGPYVFTVTDTGGNGVQGVTVTFTIAGPATLLSTSAVTDKGGSVLTSVHFSQVAGNVAITATAAGITTPAVVRTSSYAAPPSRLTASGGQGQSTTRGTPLPDLLSVLATDQYNNPVVSVLITLEATAGTLGVLSARTGADGRVTTTYTLPATPGIQTITASAVFNGVTRTVTFTATGT